MSLTMGRRGQDAATSNDDYVIVTGTERPQRPASLRIIRFFEAIVVIAIAILSFAVFWMAGLVIGVF